MRPQTRNNLLRLLRLAYRQACRIEVIAANRHAWGHVAKWQQMQAQLAQDIDRLEAQAWRCDDV